mmetsp:Transcript_146971/g.256595  ORF Transcript_146971/g.256595 Transcript_146971/m.256595 type:complete len:91 (-) Transcript_146971:247-519(-)
MHISRAAALIFSGNGWTPTSFSLPVPLPGCLWAQWCDGYNHLRLGIIFPSQFSAPLDRDQHKTPRQMSMSLQVSVCQKLPFPPTSLDVDQ